MTESKIKELLIRTSFCQKDSYGELVSESLIIIDNVKEMLK